MTETATSSEFLLGLEEYLRFINEINKSEMIHILSKALDSSEPEIESIKTYFRFLTTDIKDKKFLNYYIGILGHTIQGIEK
jgi:hypothetical protein